MKKIVAVAAALMTLAAGAAHAEHKLLVTDLLNPGQVEAQANLEYFTSRGNLNIMGESGKQKESALESRYSIGAGIGFGAEVLASVPFIFTEHSRIDVAGETESEKRDGFGDITLGIKKGLFEFQGLKSVVGLDVKFDTAKDSDGGTGTTDVRPYLAISKDMGHHLVPYASYRAIIRNHNASDSHVVSFGFEKGLTKTATLDVKAEVAFNTSSHRDGSSNQTYGLEAGAYLKLARNFYVIPSVAFFSNTKYEAGDARLGSVRGFRPGVAVYYLF